MEDSGHKQSSSGENKSCDCQRHSLTDKVWDCVRRRCRDKEEQKRFSKLLLNKHCGLSSPTSICVLTSCNRSQVKYLFWRPGARNVWPNNFIVAGWFTINLTSSHLKLSLLKSTRPLVKGTTPQYFDDGQKTAVNLSLFLKCHLSTMKTSAVNLYCQWPLDNKIKFWDQCLDSSSRCNDQWCCDWQEDLCHAESGQSEARLGSCWPMRGGMSQARDMLWRVRSLTCCVSRSPCWQEFHVASLTNTASVLLLPSDFLCVFMISSSYKLTHWPQCSARAAHIVNILGRSI